jgi:hypothetical protein
MPPTRLSRLRLFLPHPPVLLLAAVLLLAGAADARAAWEVINRVVIQHGPLVIDHGRGIAEITQAQKQGGFRAEIGLGLFQNRIKTELEVGPLRSGPGGGRLAMTTRISTAPVIYIARELPKDSCAYKAVLGHELLHQKFDLEVLRALPDQVRRLGQEVFPPDEFQRGGRIDMERAKQRFLGQLGYVYDSLGFPLHGAIDNPDSYGQLSRACNGEIARQLGLAPPPGGAKP